MDQAKLKELNQKLSPKITDVFEINPEYPLVPGPVMINNKMYDLSKMEMSEAEEVFALGERFPYLRRKNAPAGTAQTAGSKADNQKS